MAGNHQTAREVRRQPRPSLEELGHPDADPLHEKLR
jgi:hypothetical protein